MSASPNEPFPPCGGRLRSLSEASPSLGGAGWGVARRQPRALARVPRVEGPALHHPSQPSPARGEGVAATDVLQHSLCGAYLATLIPIRRRRALSFLLRVRLRRFFRMLRQDAAWCRGIG